MWCGIRWKVLAILISMAALPLPLFWIGKLAVERYACDRELVDATNDTQLAAKAIEDRLIEIDRTLIQLAIRNASAPGSAKLDAALAGLAKEDYPKVSPRHQPGVIYSSLETVQRSSIVQRIADVHDLAPEVITDMKQKLRSDQFHVGTTFWFGPWSSDRRISCWAVYPLGESGDSPEEETEGDAIVAQINLTPTFENARSPRAFLTILNRDGDRLFPDVVMDPSASATGDMFPSWDEFTKNDGGKAARLKGETFRPPHGKSGLDLPLFGVPPVYYRQLSFRFKPAIDGTKIEDFRGMVDSYRDQYRSDTSHTRVECTVIKSSNNDTGELRLRSASRQEIDRIQAELLASWNAEHPDTIQDLSLSYESLMNNLAVSMVGINFPRSRSDSYEKPSTENPDFTLANAISLTEIKQAAVSQLVRPAQFLLVAMLAVCILGSGFAWYVTQPLMVMTRAAQELTSRIRGNSDGADSKSIDVDLPINRSDEVGALAQAFSEMSAQVIASNRELNERVQRRTRELETSKQKLEEYVKTLQRTSHELEEQRDRANLADRAKTGFLATVSHEMKTPLHWLSGYAGRLKKSTLDERQQRCVDKIYEAIDQLTHLIGDVLDYQKILLGGMGVELEIIDPQSLCARLVESMTSRAEERGNTLLLDMQCQVDEFVTDPHRLNQILSNLITNACKFTENGEIHLRVSRRHETEDLAEQLVFEVSDNGVGILADDLQSLFTPFEKRKAKQGNKDGTGLGLVICRELARLLGGDVTVTSQIDVGTTFTVSLPTNLDPDATVCSRKIENDSMSLYDTGVIFQGESKDRPTVLIIDDDQRSVDLLSAELESANCRVLTALDGQSGIDQAIAAQPDLIALDIVMPGMDGWEVLTRLKDLETTKDIPVILVSIVSESRKGLTLGADGFLTKPFEPTELKRVMQRVLHWRGGSVLMVDDDANSREIARDILEPLELNISEAADGECALEHIMDSMPDVILLDLNMPRMNGFELIEQLRSRDLLNKTRVIVVSGRDLSTSERASLSDSVISFIDKAALDERQLKTEIRRLLTKTFSSTAKVN